MDREAEELFGRFQTYAERHKNRDALCHCNYYNAMLRLRTRSVRDLTRDEILGLKGKLRVYAPSEYMPESFRKAWTQMKAILEFLLSIRELYEDPRSILHGDGRLLRIVDLAKAAEVTGRVGLLRRADSKRCNPIEPVQFREIGEADSESGVSIMEQLDRLPVVIADGEAKGLAAELSYVKRGIGTVVLEHKGGDGRVQCEFSAERILTRGDREVIYGLGAVLALLDQVRQRVAQPVFLFGMVPTIEAPTYGTRAGRIEFPIGGSGHA
jgi:hypothetical protein